MSELRMVSPNTTVTRMESRAFQTGDMLLRPLSCDEQMKAQEGKSQWPKAVTIKKI